MKGSMRQMCLKSLMDLMLADCRQVEAALMGIAEWGRGYFRLAPRSCG